MTNLNCRENNIMDDMIGFVDIEIYNTKKNKWAQGKFLVHRYDDVFWTDDPDEAAQFIKRNIIKMLENEKYCN